MNILEYSHTRTPINGSFMVNVVVELDGDYDNDVLVTQLLKEAEARVSLIKLEHYRTQSVNMENVILTMTTVNGLPLELYCRLNAKLFHLLRTTNFKYMVQLSPLASTYKTRDHSLLNNSKALFTGLFRNNRSLIKLLQAYKRQLEDPEIDITTDGMITLLIQLIQVYIGNEDVNEDDIIDLLKNNSSLKDLVMKSLT